MKGARALRIATRGSALALVQSRQVQGLLGALVPDAQIELLILRSTGDRNQGRFTELPTVGVFVKELEEALSEGRAEFAVHSLKDMPTRIPEGLAIAAVLEREDARDALVSREGLRLSELPAGARIATSSPRRKAQLMRLRPDLVFVEVRGNVDTRIAKLRRGEFEALVLAHAGLRRLGRSGEATELLDLEVVLPAPGQGAVAIETRGEGEARQLAAALDHARTRAEVAAERAFLLALGGGCSVPVGALGRFDGEFLQLDVVVADPDSGLALRGRRRGKLGDAELIGAELASELLAAGARRLLPAATPAPSPLRPALAGRRVLITRPRYPHERLGPALETHGAELLWCPAIEVAAASEPAALARTATDAASYDWILFTSANAVRAFADALDGAGKGGRPRLRAAAVGPATAAVATEHGFDVQVVAEETAAVGLGREIVSYLRPGDRVLFPRARDASSALAEALAGLEIELTEVEAYRTVAPATLARDLARVLEGPAVDAITFASASAVRNLLAALAPGQRRDLFANAVVACIGARTADAARASGLKVDVTPAAASGEGLAEALVEHFRRRE